MRSPPRAQQYVRARSAHVATLISQPAGHRAVTTTVQSADPCNRSPRAWRRFALFGVRENWTRQRTRHPPWSLSTLVHSHRTPRPT